MKTWKDFLSFTNIRERIASLLIMLMLLSILYCSIYSMLVIFLIAFAYTSFMNAFFQYGTLFAVNSGVVDIMTRSNPFMDAMELGLSLFDNMQLLPAFLVSVVYGVVMCLVLVFYYTFMVCIYDEDVHV